MQWTKEKPKSPGLYWWQRSKKTKIYLLKVELWETTLEPYFMAIIVDTYSGEDELGEDFPFIGWDQPKDFDGYWSETQIEKPRGYYVKPQPIRFRR